MVLTLHKKLVPIGQRVEWARKHIRDLEGTIDLFLASDPYEIKTKPDANVPTCVRYYVASIRNEPPISIPLITGDVLFNLRATLDHLAYYLTLANGTTDKNILGETSFPIFDSEAKYNEGSRKRMRGIAQEAKDAIDTIKPYKGGNDLLWQLHRLNIIDKHRILITVGSAVGWHSLPINIEQGIIDDLDTAYSRRMVSDWEAVMGSHAPAEIAEIHVRPTFRKCPLEEGDELSLAWIDPTLHQNHDLNFKFEIAFAETGILEAQPVLDTLKEMARVIDQIILDFNPLIAS